ncbi:hypothetical protein [Streptomyces malaysiensis]|uniref:Uncharacterized protein n=1 Tax=Streptomyces malaysiensis subsp. samsunensis TaxID=459658 RepID=A0A9X2RVN3_STRMQ|nr:hypothetical protein [Streptomyces samsunensis]MCQ8829934.1 hypothetical protein [Streptomyces samsunensis]
MKTGSDLLTRVCGRCGHTGSSHQTPDPNRGIGRSPPQACRVRRGCPCIVFVPAREWCSPEVRHLIERRLSKTATARPNR